MIFKAKSSNVRKPAYKLWPPSGSYFSRGLFLFFFFLFFLPLSFLSFLFFL